MNPFTEEPLYDDATMVFTSVGDAIRWGEQHNRARFSAYIGSDYADIWTKRRRAFRLPAMARRTT